MSKKRKLGPLYKRIQAVFSKHKASKFFLQAAMYKGDSAAGDLQESIGRPICQQEGRYLGGCMPEDKAWDIAFAHQRISKHPINVESC